MALEQPNYSVVREIEDVELRKYDTFYIAECTVANVAELREASSLAFNRLFNYISGRNAAAQKIAMTTPVRQEPAADGWKLSFVVPQSLVASGIPAPTDVSIRIKEVAGAVYAVHRYRGLWNSARFAAKSAHLLEVLSRHGLSASGEVVGAAYNPPMTPPPLRRNEVMVKVGESV